MERELQNYEKMAEMEQAKSPLEYQKESYKIAVKQLVEFNNYLETSWSERRKVPQFLRTAYELMERETEEMKNRIEAEERHQNEK